MNVIAHVLINLTLGSLFLFVSGRPIFSNELVIIVISGVLIDIDHIFNEIWKGTIKNPKKIIKYLTSIADLHTGELYFFHSYEFLLLIAYLSFYQNIFFYVLIGLVFHFMADAITNTRATKSLNWLKEYSVLYNLLKVTFG